MTKIRLEDYYMKCDYYALHIRVSNKLLIRDIPYTNLARWDNLYKFKICEELINNKLFEYGIINI